VDADSWSGDGRRGATTLGKLDDFRTSTPTHDLEGIGEAVPHGGISISPERRILRDILKHDRRWVSMDGDEVVAQDVL